MDNRRGRKAFGTVLAGGVAVVVLGAVGDPAGAQTDPGGGNGTIKIDGVEFDRHPDNEPKPGCSFQVDFYGFDVDDLYADVVFTGQGATGGGTIESGRVELDRDANDGGGSEGGIDGAATFDLTAELTAPGAPFSLGEDGRYQVRVDITVFQDDGAGGVEQEAAKTKVFKLPACAQSTPPNEQPPPPGGGTPTEVSGGSTPRPASTPTPAGGVAAAPAAQVAGVSIARTGTSANTRIALAGLGALVAGLGLVVYASAMRGATRSTG